MGRHRIPTATQEAKGAFRKDPQRKAERGDLGADGKVKAACTAPIGDPPARLRLKAREFWYELIAIIPPGILNASHRWWLEITCRLMAKDTRGKASASERSQLMKGLSMMGMSPVDQSKVVAKNETANEFAEFQTANSTRPN